METNKLLQVIDNRIRKILKEKNIVTKYVGKVVGVIDDDWVKVTLAGNDTVFTMANQSLNYLSVGDDVFIETISGDLNTGVIKQRFNTLTTKELSTGATRHIIQKNVFPIGSVVLTLNKENPSRFYGGEWVQIAEGTFLISASVGEADPATGYTPKYPVGSTGGEAEHTLTIQEMPSHTHKFKLAYGGNDPLAGFNYGNTIAGIFENTDMLKETGNNKPHNNIPPFLAVYMWQRIL